MESRKIAMVIVGILLVLVGVVFALQGDGVIGGSMMSGNSTYIYVGAIVAIIGVIVLALGAMSKPKVASAPTATTPAK